MASNRTIEIRTAELIKKINEHDNKEELIQLMFEQVADDTAAVRCEDKAIYEDIKLDKFYESIA